ncbi:MAG TPA: GNAT family N-acetyltransferase [Clostridia bacterium]|jgi:diamine N-acetyltransferase|nr:GNAT family N-acetyltransferase [Clostridia bacterium]HRX42513.1 GNAT family N-acetyltransferase [Clostridia bacterium]
MELREISMENFLECIKLSVSDMQKGFVASNMFSLAEAKADGVSVPLAIYDGDTMVGFIMYDYDEKERTGWISRLMVDQRYQGRGHGRWAMMEVIGRLREIEGIKIMRTSFAPENSAARKLYTSLGFKLTGEQIDGEDVCIMEI